jgi:two-component system chemotaxis response regulator CheY
MVKVLVVDDDRSTVRLLHTLLELDGFAVVSVGLGAEVLGAIEQHQPDIMLLDYHLTDMHGVEIVRALRAMPQYQAFPIVIASGLDVEDEVIRAGASAFLVKPYDPGELPNVFHRLLGT